MTPQEEQLASATVDAFLKTALGWKYGIFKSLAPANTEDQVAVTIVTVADAHDGDVPAKEHAAALALYKKISDAGYAGQVTSSQCAALAHSVYQSVLKTRST